LIFLLRDRIPVLFSDFRVYIIGESKAMRKQHFSYFLVGSHRHTFMPPGARQCAQQAGVMLSYSDISLCPMREAARRC